MDRYIGQMQTWSDHHGRHVSRGVIYDTSRRRGSYGDVRRDFGFVEFTDLDTLELRLSELNQVSAKTA